MNDKWQGGDGACWNTREKQRIAERFRSHVRTKSNPRGRIHREKCYFCTREYPNPEEWPHLPRADAHHVDYARPFVVAWLCFRHHRAVDHGRALPPTALHDYFSLVAPLIRRGLEGNKNQKGDGTRQGVPF
jgi:hypothetical protein